MSGIGFVTRRGTRAQRVPRLALAAVLLGTLGAAASAADDPYLQMLDAEVSKVEGAPTDNTNSSSPVAAGAGDASAPTASRDRFESQLREQHVGTYSFYRRLPERSREEVFLDYSNGASMDSLRDKIVDRFLHP